MKKKKYSNEDLNELFLCWQEKNTYKERLELVAEKLPHLPQIEALNVMRKMAMTDKRWIKFKKQKNERLKKEKLAKQKERLEKSLKAKTKSEKKKIQNQLNETHKDQLKNVVKDELFYCGKVVSFTSTISCIYKIYGGKDEYGFSAGEPCESCTLMNKYLPKIKEIINKEV